MAANADAKYAKTVQTEAKLYSIMLHLRRTPILGCRTS